MAGKADGHCTGNKKHSRMHALTWVSRSVKENTNLSWDRCQRSSDDTGLEAAFIEVSDLLDVKQPDTGPRQNHHRDAAEWTLCQHLKSLAIHQNRVITVSQMPHLSLSPGCSVARLLHALICPHGLSAHLMRTRATALQINGYVMLPSLFAMFMIKFSRLVSFFLVLECSSTSLSMRMLNFSACPNIALKYLLKDLLR